MTQSTDPSGALLRKRVCLVTPGQLSTNPRLVREADALWEAGYDVHVIAASFLEWADVADCSFANRRWAVEKVAFGPRAPRVRYLRQSLTRRIAAAMWRVAPLAALAAPAFHPAYPDLARRASRLRADLYIAHNLAALTAAAKAARRFKGVLAFDAEDYHLGQLSLVERAGLEGRLTRSIESASLKECAFVTASSPGIAEAYVREYGLRSPTVIPNVMPLAHAPEPTERNPAREPSIFWFSQTIGPGRGIEAAVRAIGLSRSRPFLRLLGNRNESFTRKLLSLARDLGVQDRVLFEAPVAPERMPTEAAQSDLGLAGEEGASENSELAWSNKLFTYVLAGIPTLATDTRGQTDLAQRYPGVITFYRRGDVQDQARAIDAAFEDRPRLEEQSRVARKLARTELCWEVWMPRWLKLVAEAVGAP